MAGLCGVVGAEPRAEEVAGSLEWTGEESTTKFETDEIAVVGSFRTSEGADQPVSVGEDGRLWVWGSVVGFDDGSGYRPRESFDGSTAAYCARLYDRHGPAFVAGLNGDFVGVHYDRAAGAVAVFTDRLGLRDAYYTRAADDTVVFSTAAQSLSRHPAVRPAFDQEYVTEYLACDFRTFGVRTPLEGTARFPPGAVTTIDTSSGSIEPESYWEPRYRPLDRPFSYFVEEFTDRFERTVTERIRPDREYGLLLSGGADSRLVLAAMDSATRERLTAYHMSGWLNREARIARAVAETAGVDFEWLERDADYHRRALRRTPRLSNFVGTFEQAHAEGFVDEFRGEVDEMVTASFADSNFKGYSFPRYSLPLGPLGSVDLPVFRPMDSVDRYIDAWAGDPPRYLDSGVDIKALLRQEIRATGSGVEHHGITYGSPEELFVCGTLTPRTNGSVLFLLQSLRQHLPAWSPFVDNRLVDLYLSMPTKYFARRNVIHRATARLDPALGEITYPATGLPLYSPFPAHYLGELVTRFRDKFAPVEDPPAPHLGHSSLPDLPALVRERSFVRDAIHDHRTIIETLPFLNWEGARACYQAHLNGENNHRELYGLLTLLAMPVTGRIAEQIASEESER
jgi:asparagine synthase (glutamine-hydrolysing)